MVFDKLKKAIFDTEVKNPSMSDFIKTSNSFVPETSGPGAENSKPAESVNRNDLNIPKINDLYDNYQKNYSVKFSDNSVYKVEEFYKTLETVPRDMRTNILLGIIDTAGLSVEDLKQEALVRKEVLNDMLVHYKEDKMTKIDELHISNTDLENKIKENKETIKKNEDELSEFSGDVFSEITRLDSILSYMNVGE